MYTTKLAIIVTAILIYFTENCTSSKLNVPRVLLPVFDSFNLNFTLEVIGCTGCYSWSTSRDDIIQLTPLDGDDLRCARKVNISTSTKERTRSTAIVFAEDIELGSVLRCDVILDVIDSLNIITTTRELFMEEAPEAFEVRAYDDQGNEFTTLEGVEFDWSVTNWKQRDTLPAYPDVLRFISFEESPYETPPTVATLDRKGFRGHMVLLEGSKTGSAKVSVKLPHKEYRHVVGIEVQLNVVANIIIIPSDVYIMPGDVVEMQVFQIQYGRLEEIEWPSPHYCLEIEDESIASGDKLLNKITGLQVGRTKVFVRDRNLDTADLDIKVPSATLTVSEPAYLKLDILPHHNWAVFIDDFHQVVIEIYDRDNHKLRIGPDVDIQTLIPMEYFNVIESSKNGSYFNGTGVQSGTAQIHSTLVSVKTPSGELRVIMPKISAQANLMIYPRIVVHPPEVVVPWHPVVKPRYEIKLVASGGDGKYFWESGNSTVAVVSQSGLVRTLELGTVPIFAAMTINHNNKGKSHFHVLPPQKLEIMEYALEEVIGGHIFLHIALYAEKVFEDNLSHMIPFTKCSDLPYVVKIWDEVFTYNHTLTTSPVGIACATIGVVAQITGFTKVTVSLKRDDVTLEDTVTIASYKPLKVQNPESAQVVLAVGSSRLVAFADGPRPWPERVAEHVKQIDPASKNTILDIEEITDHDSEVSDVYIYKVMCRKVGEAEISLTVSNAPLLRHCKTSRSSASVRVFCAKPRWITLKTELHLPDNSKCPINFNTQRIVVHNYNDFEVSVILKDENGREFDNITSLNIDWTLSDESIGLIPEAGTVIEETVQLYGVVFPVRYYQIVRPMEVHGVLEIKAKVTGYKNEMLESFGVVAEYPPFFIINDKGFPESPEIETVISLVLVQDTVISPNKTFIFNHPENIGLVHVLEGSGYYEFILSTEDLASISYLEGSRTIEVIPKANGLLKLALIDLCLPSKPALAEIYILGVGNIRVEAPDKVERGRCVQAIVHLYDTMENILPVPDPTFLNIRPVLESEIISVKLSSDKAAVLAMAEKGEIPFIITGLELGDIELSFVAGSGKSEVQSMPIPIQVFPPLKLYPQVINMVVGSIFQVSHRGGPQPVAHVEYTIDGETAEVTSVGIVKAKLIGKSKLIGKAIGLNRVSGRYGVYSQDSIEINVIPLAGIKIHAPVTRIVTNAVMPLWVHGIPNEITPLLLGSVSSLKYQWSVSHPERAELCTVYVNTKIELNDEDAICLRLRTLQPGPVTIKVVVDVPAIMRGDSDGNDSPFESTYDIEIFQELRLVHPPNVGATESPYILLGPDAEIQLYTNHEKSVIYSVIDVSLRTTKDSSGNDQEDLTRAISNTNPAVTVDKNGLVRSYSNFGRCLVLVYAEEDFGLKQIMGVVIEVKPINYVMLEASPAFQVVENERVSALPVGISFPLTVTFHDNLGKVFTATSSDVKIRKNRFDLLELYKGKELNSIRMTVSTTGSAMVKVWDDHTYSHSHSGDYLKVPVAELITPSSMNVTLGDVICFSIPIKSTDPKYGFWSTDDDSVLILLPELGIGRARSVGKVTVRYHLGERLVTHITVNVLPVYKVKLLPSKDRIITNSLELSYRVPLVLLNQLEPSKKLTKLTSTISKNGTCSEGYFVTAFPFYCILEFSDPNADYDIDDVFAVHQDFNLQKGEYSCEILSAGDPAPGLSTLRSNITLTVDSHGVVSNPLTLSFMPAVYISTPVIHLSDSRMTGKLVVNGIDEVLSQIEVTPGDRLLSVSEPDIQPMKSSYVYHVLLSESYWDIGELSTQLNVSVISPITSQSIQIPVKVHLTGEKHIHAPCMVSHVRTWGSHVTDVLYYYRHTMAIIVALLVILLCTVYCYTLFMGQDGGYRPEYLHRPPDRQQFYYQQPPTIPAPGTPPLNNMSSMRYSPSMNYSYDEPVYGDTRSIYNSPDYHSLRLRHR